MQQQSIYMWIKIGLATLFLIAGIALAVVTLITAI